MKFHFKSKRSKYRNVKTVYDGISFDSKKEAAKYAELKLLLHTGKFVKFERQVPYKFIHNGILLCTYRADFVITWKDGRTEVFDVKGRHITPYPIKKKMMKAFYGIDIIEC